MNEPEKKKSTKKTLGIVGSCIVFGIAITGTFLNPSETANILYPLMLFVGALFGIHTFGNVQHHKANNG